MNLKQLQSRLRKRDAIPNGWKKCPTLAVEWGVTLGYVHLKMREAMAAGLVERRQLQGESDTRRAWYYHFKKP